MIQNKPIDSIIENQKEEKDNDTVETHRKDSMVLALSNEDTELLTNPKDIERHV